MEHVLKGMPLDCHDGLYPEDRALVRRELAQRLHERRQLSRDDLALGDEGERVHPSVVPVVAVRVAMPMAMPCAGMADMSAVSMVLAAVRVVAVAVATAISAVALCVAMAPGMRSVVLLDEIRLLLDVFVDEVAHVVRSEVAQLLHANFAFDGSQNLGELVDRPDAISNHNRLLRADQVQLIQDDFVRECDLLVGLVDLALFNLVVEPAHKVLCVGQGNDCVEPQVHRELGVRHEGAHDWHGVGHAGGLYHDLVDVGPGLDVVQDLLQSIREVAADGAAHAAVVHDHDLLCHGQLRLRQQCVVDRDLAELILDDGDLLLLLLLENEVEQSGLARA
mmetsp:Transcript_6790/g.13708  ORF Transcript_6790/g.13708 Transcript_6790/m.13708 type:complete len:335 (+) Transcript_6790:534-1538(+)